MIEKTVASQHVRIQIDDSTEEQQMALSAESSTLSIAIKVMLFKKTTRGIKVFIFGVDPFANSKPQKILGKNSSQNVFLAWLAFFVRTV